MYWWEIFFYPRFYYWSVRSGSMICHCLKARVSYSITQSSIWRWCLFNNHIDHLGSSNTTSLLDLRDSRVPKPSRSVAIMMATADSSKVDSARKRSESVQLSTFITRLILWRHFVVLYCARVVACKFHNISDIIKLHYLHYPCDLYNYLSS